MCSLFRYERGSPGRLELGKRRTDPSVVLIVLAGLAMGALYLGGPGLAALVPCLSSLPSIEREVILISTMGLVYLAAVWVVTRSGGSPRRGGLTAFILLSGILFRGFLVASPPILSSDVYRYVWDGRVQVAGVNPYQYPPSAPELVPLRDEAVYPRINRKDYPTIYPAGAQILFGLFASMSGGVLAFKALMTSFDLLSMLALLALVRIFGTRDELVLLYAWNPLVIHEVVQSGHLEGATLFFIILALVLHLLGKRTSGIVSLAVAASFKLYPALLLPALLNKGERAKGMALFSACFAAAYLPYLGAGSRVVGFLPRYFTWEYESFNLGLKPLLTWLFPVLSYNFLSGVLVLGMGAAGAAMLFREKSAREAVRLGEFMMGLMILLMPTALHPWYVLPVIPFQVVLPSSGWLIFSCVVPLSYLKYTSEAGVVPYWVLLAEYLPLGLLLAVQLAHRHWSLRRGGLPETLAERR